MGKTNKTAEEFHIEKEMLVQLESTGSHVTITHKLTNKGMWPVDLALKCR